MGVAFVALFFGFGDLMPLWIAGIVAGGAVTSAILLAAGPVGRSATRYTDQYFAERGARGVAWVRGYDPVGAPPSGSRPGRFHLEVELDLPGRPAATYRYWTVVPELDVARLTTVGRFPCVATSDEPPLVRLYLRRDVTVETLEGGFLFLAPR